MYILMFTPSATLCRCLR